MSDQLASFNSRIKRINDPRNTFYLDPETGIKIPKRLSRKIIKTNNSYVEQKAGLGSMLFSVVLGLVCLVLAQYLRFELAGVPNTEIEPSTLTAMDGGLAAILVFIVGGVLKHKSLRHMASQIVGIGIMIVAIHNLVWLFPEEFSQVFSDDYVQQVTQATVPLSLHFNGETLISL